MLERQVDSAGRHAACLGNDSIPPSDSDASVRLHEARAQPGALSATSDIFVNVALGQRDLSISE
jgi:hypothetical protein